TGVVFNGLTPPGNLPVWSGTVTWYWGTTSASPAPPSGPVIPGSGTTVMTFGDPPTVAHGKAYTWYAVTLPPLTWNATSVLVDSAVSATMATLGSSLYMACTDSSGNVSVKLSTDGATWVSLGAMGSDGRGSLAAFKGALYYAGSIPSPITLKK